MKIQKKLHKWNFAPQSFEEYILGARSGKIEILSRLMSLSENPEYENQKFLLKILKELKADWLGSSSTRIGVTGPPGVGKSTFIEHVGLYYCQKGTKVAVLAIDPSSRNSHGSILGDKTRMQNLSQHPFAYIRPQASGNHLGGLNSSVSTAILFCEVFGYELILIESVGVGQNEIEIYNHADTVILLDQPGTGDDLQAVKRGIMEMCDTIVIHKADGNLLPLAKEKKKYLQSMVQDKNIILHSSLAGSLSDTLIDSFTVSPDIKTLKRTKQLHALMVSEAEIALQTMKNRFIPFDRISEPIPLGVRIQVMEKLDKYFGNHASQT